MAGRNTRDSLHEGEIPRGYKRNFVKCRALGHSWMHSNDVITHETKAWVRGLSSLCDVCGTVRVRWLSSNGGRWGMTYTYPDGYGIKWSKRNNGSANARSGPALRATEWRREFVSRLDFPEQTEPINR